MFNVGNCMFKGYLEFQNAGYPKSRIWMFDTFMNEIIDMFFQDALSSKCKFHIHGICIYHNHGTNQKCSPRIVKNRIFSTYGCGTVIRTKTEGRDK